MRFNQVCQHHIAGKPLYFTHPDLQHTMIFDADGKLSYQDDFGKDLPIPLYLSDFDRDDWYCWRFT